MRALRGSLYVKIVGERARTCARLTARWLPWCPRHTKSNGSSASEPGERRK